MKKILLLLSFIFIYSVTIADEPIKWYSFDEGLTKAKNENKILLVDFYTDWCGWCKKMEASTYTNKKVIDLLNKNFITAKLNPEKEGYITFNNQKISNGEFAQAVQVTGFPTTGFFRNDSVFIGKAAGYLDANNFIDLLDKVIKSKPSGK